MLAASSPSTPHLLAKLSQVNCNYEHDIQPTKPNHLSPCFASPSHHAHKSELAVPITTPPYESVALVAETPDDLVRITHSSMITHGESPALVLLTLDDEIHK